MKTLITGHGTFAEGMKSSVELIAGYQENLNVLVFDESTNLTKFKNDIVEFCSGDEEATIFTDLLGGTPFNMSMIAKSDRENIHVFTGTNLPMLLQYVSDQMMRNLDVVSLREISEIAKEGITIDLEPTPSKIIEESDGI